MTEKECIERMSDLKQLISLYSKLYFDNKSFMYKESSVINLKKLAEKELYMLEESMHNQELEDSYDQNTGW